MTSSLILQRSMFGAKKVLNVWVRTYKAWGLLFKSVWFEAEFFPAQAKTSQALLEGWPPLEVFGVMPNTDLYSNETSLTPPI